MSIPTCICGADLPEVPLTWGRRRFCSLACFSAWYVLDGNTDGAPGPYREYAGHVENCATCSKADQESGLCAAGGALFDALDEDPTDPLRPAT